jgi:hypothetical protein
MNSLPVQIGFTIFQTNFDARSDKIFSQNNFPKFFPKNFPKFCSKKTLKKLNFKTIHF